MSLSSEDLHSIRLIVKEENQILSGKFEALENGILAKLINTYTCLPA